MSQIFFDMGAEVKSAIGFNQTAVLRGAMSATTPEHQTELSPALRADFDAVQRGDFSGDMGTFAAQMAAEMTAMKADFQRTITSATTGVPIRENLEAPAILLMPDDTPIRNLLPRTMGSGLSSLWRQLVTLGGGWGSGVDQPGGGSATQFFYSETGAPGNFDATYAAKSASYKLLGAEVGLTAFAQSAGATYGDLAARTKSAGLMNAFLNEENALLNADATSTSAPWGNGSTAYSFNGLNNLITTANGTPSAQVVGSVGPLSLGHIDHQLERIWNQGGRDVKMICNAQEIHSINGIFADSNLYKINLQSGDAQNSARIGARVTEYVNVAGQTVGIIASRFQAAGTITFLAMTLPDGSPVADVDVLPLAPLPAGLAYPTDSLQEVQGWVMIDLPPTAAAPLVRPALITAFETLRLKSALHVAISTGITPYVSSTGIGSGW